ncbi:MFS transporter [Caldalkalibacillus thermarum]|nr:MFS transporter [Caldalkalibacillus thermarum]
MRFRDFHINIKIRLLETFISGFIGNMIFPFMAIYLSKHFGLKIAGVILLINVFIGIVINFFGGYLSDQYGRKIMMKYAEMLRFVAFVIMLLANSPWFESAVITSIMMFVNTISWGISGPAHHAMLIDVSKPEQRKLMYSIAFWVNNLAFAIGGIFGGLFFDKHLFELLLGISLGSLFCSILVVFFIQESYFPTEKTRALSHVRRIFNTYQEVFKDRLFILFTIAGILVLSMEFHLTNYIGIRLSETMPTQKFLYWNVDGVNMLGFLRTENTILVVLMSLFAFNFIKRYKDKTVLIVGSLLFVLGFGLMSYLDNIWLLIICMLFATIGEVIRIPVQQSLMASIIPDNARSSYMAVNGLSFSFAMLIASLVVTLSAFLPAIAISIIITFIGLIGVGMYYIIFNEVALDNNNSINESRTASID